MTAVGWSFCDTISRIGLYEMEKRKKKKKAESKMKEALENDGWAESIQFSNWHIEPSVVVGCRLWQSGGAVQQWRQNEIVEYGQWIHYPLNDVVVPRIFMAKIHLEWWTWCPFVSDINQMQTFIIFILYLFWSANRSRLNDVVQCKQKLNLMNYNFNLVHRFWWKPSKYEWHLLTYKRICLSNEKVLRIVL